MGIDCSLMEVILTVSESIVRGDRVRRHLSQEKAEGKFLYWYVLYSGYKENIDKSDTI